MCSSIEKAKAKKSSCKEVHRKQFIKYESEIILNDHTLSCLSSAQLSWIRALIMSLFPTTAALCNAVCSPCQQKYKDTELTTNTW